MIRQIDKNLSTRGRNPGLATAFHALSDPTRLAIFETIRDHCCDTGCSDEQATRTVTKIAEEFEVSLPTVSHHLKELRQAGLIHMDRQGQKVYCSIEPKAVRALADYLTAETALIPVSAIEHRLRPMQKQGVFEMPDATMVTERGPRTISDREQLHGRISGIAWGVLFLWVGIAMLTNLGWGIGLVGAGAIVLGAQAARRFIVELPFEGFSVIVGFVFLIGGAWKLVYGQVDLVPIVAFVAGVALILGAFTSKPAH